MHIPLTFPKILLENIQNTKYCILLIIRGESFMFFEDYFAIAKVF